MYVCMYVTPRNGDFLYMEHTEVLYGTHTIAVSAAGLSAQVLKYDRSICITDPTKNEGNRM